MMTKMIFPSSRSERNPKNNRVHSIKVMTPTIVVTILIHLWILLNELRLAIPIAVATT